MAKKQENKTAWMIISSDGFEGNYETFNLAKENAENLVEDGKENVQILEVVKAWQVIYPEEPAPETYEILLDNVDA